MTVREIQGFLLEQCGVEVSPDFISLATEGVQEEVTTWQNRPLESLYPIVVFAALRVKIRDSGSVQNKAVHLAQQTTFISSSASVACPIFGSSFTY